MGKMWKNRTQKFLANWDPKLFSFTDFIGKKRPPENIFFFFEIFITNFYSNFLLYFLINYLKNLFFINFSQNKQEHPILLSSIYLIIYDRMKNEIPSINLPNFTFYCLVVFLKIDFNFYHVQSIPYHFYSPLFTTRHALAGIRR